ncbi:MAG: chorismate synthase [Oscillospiraceae bacterium]|jgi:chorismate synthase
MSNTFGEKLKITVFGQSHSEAIGAVVDGLPAGEAIDMGAVLRFMRRRAPGGSELSTARRETDEPVILSGLLDGRTCGAPVCAVIKNSDTRPQDYDSLRFVPRPGHSDLTAFIKYGGANDIRGGGQFSGRLTAPICFAGALCLQLLSRRGVEIRAEISEIAAVTGDSMKKAILEAKAEGDSVGGIIRCTASGVPAGLGGPMFDGVESRLAQAAFAIPGIKGLCFGSGFNSARMRGSEHNDSFFFEDGSVKTRTNNHGGILGGITSGMPIIMDVAVKPTPSISKKQESVDLRTGETASLEISGRHDPCIVPRALPVVESVMGIVLLDLML